MPVVGSMSSTQERRGAAEPPRRHVRRARRAALTAVVGVVGLLAGVVLATAVLGGDDDAEQASPTTVPAAGDELPTSPEEVEARLEERADAGPGAPTATSPQAAVEGFLAAEEALDLDASFTFLSAEDRAALGGAEGWRATHADLLAPVLGFEVEAADPAEAAQPGDEAEVVAAVRFQASLDEVVGLVPGRARGTFTTVVDDDGLWGVALGASVLEPIYATDDGVLPAAEAWVAARSACDADPATERSPLLGIADLADGLCDTTGHDLGAPGALPEVDALPFLTAFGGPATTWARVVDVDGPSPLRAVLAPIGEEWTVIGVLPR